MVNKTKSTADLEWIALVIIVAVISVLTTLLSGAPNSENVISGEAPPSALAVDRAQLD